MAIITSVASANWSMAATWDIGVPGPGDSVVIAAPHTVTFDVDQSAFPAGLAGLTINGTLITDDGSDPYLKMAGNITGTGDWYIGSDVADFPPDKTMTIDFTSGARGINSNTLTLHFYCAEPTNQYVRLSALEAAGQTVLSVDTDVSDPSSLWNDGDTIKICNIDNGLDAEERIIAAGGIAANTITITVGLAAEKIEGSYITLRNRNVRVINSTNYAIQYVLPGHIGVEISNCASGYRYVYENTIGGSIDVATYAMRTCDGTEFSGSMAGSIYGLYLSDNQVLSGIIAGCGTALNGARSNNVSGIIAGCTSATAGPSDQNVFSGSIIGCGSGIVEGSACFHNATLNNNADVNLAKTIEAYNTLFSGNTEFAGYNDKTRAPWLYSFSIDHDQVAGAFKAWLTGGIVINDIGVKPLGKVQSYKHMCQDANNPVFMQREILIQPGDIFEYTVYARKDAAMAYLPRAQLIDPAEDPLKDDSFTPLAEDIMTNSVNTWETLTLTYTNTTAYPKEVIVRTLAQNATDNAWFLVEGGRVVPPVSPNPPTFDALTNDGDGDAVTLTITPPAAGNYDRTLIYYKRAGIYEAWSSGGTYVGVQGVAGTVQVTGLDDNQFYQFILVAEYSGLYSLPSALRRVLVIATTTPATMPDFVTELAEHCAARFNNLIYETNVFANHQPDVDSADPVVFFLGTGGPPGRFDDAWREITVQVLVTSPAVSGYTAGWNMIKNIESEYHGSHAWNLPSFYISTGERVQPPYPLGRDEKGREQFSFNLHFKMRRL